MEPDIAEMLRTTAKNITDLFSMLASRVEALEKENAELRSQLSNNNE